jgi:hypothetical protein
MNIDKEKKRHGLSHLARKLDSRKLCNPTRNSFFLSNMIWPKQTGNQLEIMAYARKTKLFIKTKLPKVTIKDDVDAKKEVVEACHKMIKKGLFILTGKW